MISIQINLCAPLDLFSVCVTFIFRFEYFSKLHGGYRISMKEISINIIEITVILKYTTVNCFIACLDYKSPRSVNNRLFAVQDFHLRRAIHRIKSYILLTGEVYSTFTVKIQRQLASSISFKDKQTFNHIISSVCNYICVDVFVRLLKLSLLIWPLSVIQPFCHPLTLTSPGHWATLGKQRSDLPGETISLPVLYAPNIRRPGISNLHRDRPLKVPIYTLVEWSIGYSFLVLREIHFSQCRFRTREPSICSRCLWPHIQLCTKQ